MAHPASGEAKVCAHAPARHAQEERSDMAHQEAPERWPACLMYLTAYILPLTLLISFYVVPMFTVMYAYGLVPAMDWLVGNDDLVAPLHQAHDSRQELDNRGRALYYRLVIWLWVPTHVALLMWALHQCRATQTSIASLAMLGVCMGFLGAGSINVSHELFHKSNAYERAMARLLLVLVCYGHFEVEHTMGHHKNVGTPADPATAKLGQPFFSFLPQSVLGGLRSAWTLERARVSRLRGSARSSWSPLFENRCVNAALGSSLVFLWVLAVYGLRGAAFFLLQAIVSVIILEKTNYIEHYGLERTPVEGSSESATPKYEPVQPHHSWDAPQKVSNYMLFKLQRHADHHLHAQKQYYCLQLNQCAPQLPAGYPALAVLVMCPPIWRAVMDPLVLKARSQRSQQGHVSSCRKTQ
ncbi:Alkane 1-monooxygenase [Porphyridium purpureum]|uniref:Alkane 1-monooxygenase n=1 Tax=Porphyridium purpureum TaxID=35688 RepID=A0A5J4Z0X9_PORPP|nr:Alkane 1-monooxygenase [Porphyridium purpureum]|eukprot:POR5943..scf208_2